MSARKSDLNAINARVAGSLADTAFGQFFAHSASMGRNSENVKRFFMILHISSYVKYREYVSPLFLWW